MASMLFDTRMSCCCRVAGAGVRRSLALFFILNEGKIREASQVQSISLMEFSPSTAGVLSTADSYWCEWARYRENGQRPLSSEKIAQINHANHKYTRHFQTTTSLISNVRQLQYIYMCLRIVVGVAVILLLRRLRCFCSLVSCCCSTQEAHA